jgi:carbamoyl-phosphate synthase large subunit
MEHIEEAGVHSGDSACALPPYSLSPGQISQIEQQSEALALHLGVVGLMNIQFALQEGVLYVLEVNPRASRTIPFVSKVIGHPLAYAARVMIGQIWKKSALCDRCALLCRGQGSRVPLKVPGVDVILGPKCSTGGCGIDDLSRGFLQAQIAAHNTLPTAGRVFLSVRDEDKEKAVAVARLLLEAGLTIIATGGTRARLLAAGIACEHVNQVKEGRPHVVDRIINGDVAMVINTTAAGRPILDSHSIRHQTVRAGIPYFTTIEAAQVAAQAIVAHDRQPIGTARSLQDYHAWLRSGAEALPAKSAD